MKFHHFFPWKNLFGHHWKIHYWLLEKILTPIQAFVYHILSKTWLAHIVCRWWKVWFTSGLHAEHQALKYITPSSEVPFFYCFLRALAAKQLRRCDGESDTDTTSCSECDDEAEEVTHRLEVNELTKVGRSFSFRYLLDLWENLRSVIIAQVLCV